MIDLILITHKPAYVNDLIVYINTLESRFIHDEPSELRPRQIAYQNKHDRVYVYNEYNIISCECV